jgi:hypothetical protein
MHVTSADADPVNSMLDVRLNDLVIAGPIFVKRGDFLPRLAFICKAADQQPQAVWHRTHDFAGSLHNDFHAPSRLASRFQFGDGAHNLE